MIRLTVNGRQHEIDAEPDTPLLYVLRDDLGLNGAKFGCGLGQCGACTVIVDGEALLSCLTPIVMLPGRPVTTIKKVSEPRNTLGQCSEGVHRRAGGTVRLPASPAWSCAHQALLAHTPAPTEQEIRDGMNPNLCRCGTHMRILAAVRRAAGKTPATAAAR